MFIITKEMLKVASNAERCRLFRMIIAREAMYVGCRKYQQKQGKFQFLLRYGKLTRVSKNKRLKSTGGLKMNYSCQEEYDYYMQAQAEAEAEGEAIIDAMKFLVSVGVEPNHYKSFYEANKRSK